MITINVKDGVQAADAAHKARRLLAQRTKTGGCLYRNGGRSNGSPCLIGAMLSDEDWRADIGPTSKNEDGFSDLLETGVFKLDVSDIPNTDVDTAAALLAGLQSAHDNSISSYSDTRTESLKMMTRRLADAMDYIHTGVAPYWVADYR